LASLIILALYERLPLGEAEGFDFAHGIVEQPSAPSACATASSPIRRSFRIRRSAISMRSSRHRVQKIDRKRAARWPAPSGEGDTIWMGAADSSGLAGLLHPVESIGMFGSGCVLPHTGVLMQNRGASFSLDPSGEPARARPPAVHSSIGARSAHVAASWLTAPGRRCQPQTQAMLFARHVLHRQPLDKALDAPRWLLGRTWGSTHTTADGIALSTQPDRPA